MKTDAKRQERWAQRKRAEDAQRIETRLSDVVTAGGPRNLFMARCRLMKVKSDYRKRERQILETTSLGDLIH
jgi:hypothetical protein